jgi:UDP-N-acetylglucosamine 2-epimerase (non-hydrolysing)
MEAGNRCRDERLPEETNRRVVDVVADVNMAYSEHARRWLAASGCAPERTFVTGSPMPEVLRRNLARIDASDVVGRLGLEPGRYFLLSAHREENVDDRASLEGLFGAVNALAGRYGLPVLYSCHPRSRRRLEEAGVALHPLVRMHEPLGFHDYNRLQADSLCTLSDSGTLPEEAAFFAGEGRPFPAVSLRTSTERPEAVDRACFVLAGTGEAGLLQAVELAVRMHRDGCRPAPVPDYADENVSDKVVKIIQSYTGVVDRVVWGRRP